MTPHPAPPAEADRDIAGLLHRLRIEGFDLLRAELALARTELIDALNQLLRAAMLGVVGAVLMLAGLFALLAAAIIVLSLWLPLSLSACVVGVVLLLAGVLVFRSAHKKADVERLALHHTRQSVQQDLDLVNRKAHEQVHSQHEADLGARAAHSAAASPR